LGDVAVESKEKHYKTEGGESLKATNTSATEVFQTLNAIFGPGVLASEIAKGYSFTPEQLFRKVFKAGVIDLDGDGYVCRQLAVPPCKAASGQKPIMPRKHGKINKIASYLRCPEGIAQVSQAIQSQGGILNHRKFFVNPWNPSSWEEGAQKLIKIMNDLPDLLVMVVDEMKEGVARVDFQKSDPVKEEIHKVAVEKDVTVFWIGDSASLPPGAGTIRISQEQGQSHYTVTIEQEGLGTQKFVFEPNHGARLGTYAKNVSEDAVLAFLHSQGGAKVKKALITKRFALSNFDADRILNSLIVKGDVTKPEKGYFAAVLKKPEQQ
jgi:hypothetical protein